MRAILSAALVLGFCGLAIAADDKKPEDKKADDKKGGVNPIGLWKCEYKIGETKRTSELTVTKDGDKIAATISWPDQKDVKVKDLKMKDSELTFSAVRKVMDMEITVEYKLTLDGDKLKGKGAAEFNGSKQEFDIEGKREKKEEKKEEKKDK